MPVVPIDLGWEGLRHARSMGVERLAQANALALPFRGGSFDLTLSLDVMPHFRPATSSARSRTGAGDWPRAAWW